MVFFSCSGDDCSRSLQTRTSSIFCVCSIRTSMEDRRSCLPWPLSREWAGDSQTLYARRQTWTWVNGRFPRGLIRLWIHSLLCHLQSVVEIFLQSCRCVPYQTIMKYVADIWPSRHHATNLAKYSGLASLGEIFVKRLSMWCPAFVLPPSSREGILVNRVVLSRLRHYLLPVVQGFFSQNSQTHIHNINFHCWTISCSHNLS